MLRALLKKSLPRLLAAFVLCCVATQLCRAETATGFFRVEQCDGIWWFITPDGKPFFSSGVNVVGKGQSRENYNPKNPEYAAFQHYPNDSAWMDDTLKRLQAWNFNTIGGWSNEELQQRGALPYTKVLHLSGGKSVPWGDVFSRTTEARINAEARREIGRLKDDKNLIGYFTDNELGWWDDTVFWHFLNQPATSKTRQVLLQLLRVHYGNDFARLRRDFDTGRARSFAALMREANLTLKPNGNGAEVIDIFIFLVAERYYKLAHDAIRRYDPHHLILGDRYPSWYSQSVARAAIPYVDVISTNYMADWTDGNISHFYLDTLYRLTNKPIIITEYYMSATENRSGNKNTSAGFPVVQTQRERAESFRNNLTAYAGLPFVVGAHWFQYTDEPSNGRSDGEDYNMGLIDIHNQPYAELTAAATALKPEEIHVDARQPNPANAVTAVPQAAKNAEKGLRWWNKKASLVRAESNFGDDLPFADLYAVWDLQNLWLAIYAADFVEPRLYARHTLPEAERMTLTLKLDSGAPVKIRFDQNGAAKIEGAGVIGSSWANSTRSTLLIKIPASAIGKQNWRANDKLQLQAQLSSHSRAETMQWRQTLNLSDE